jgi:tetratricopeptide (TPR) repeat protein
MTPALSRGPAAGDPSGTGSTGARVPGTRPARPDVLVGVLLAASVVAVYAQTSSFALVNWDDWDYVVYNPRVNTGLSASNVAWAFTHTHSGNWHPLTWVSHMLDCELFGLAPGGHHITGVLIHAAAAVLLFVAFRRLTGDRWPSAFVAAAFALHPLRVESVAWVSERKDVLSGLFFALLLLSYERYARGPTRGRYALVALTLALGLMAKSMLVTAPFVLLLLDYWPLRRLDTSTGMTRRRVLAEKVPLLAMTVAAALITLAAQTKGGAVSTLENVPFGRRVDNALVAYVVYLGQTVYPADLAALYPFPTADRPPEQVLGAAAVLAVFTGVAVALRRRRPAVLIGWLWYLGMLVPVIGFINFGLQAHADRYTYLPQIGLWVALAWGVRWSAVAPHRVIAAGAVVVLGVWAGVSARQVGYWRNEETLCTHNLDCARPNLPILFTLGHYLLNEKRYAEAVDRLTDALRYGSEAKVHYNLAQALVGLGRDAEAIDHFRTARELRPDLTEARTNEVVARVTEGTKLARAGRPVEALQQFDAALALDPQHPGARRNKATVYLNLGLAAAQSDRPRDAVEAFRSATQADPTLAVAQNNLGVALMELREFGAAADAFRAALRIDPNDGRARANLEKALSHKGP